ncbi:MAG: ion channel [Lachnospiraceae bacterium]|nr:ion channel [Lachnospiraceae bacterium]
MKQSKKILVALTGILLILPLLLLLAERRAGSTTIRSYGDAIWYTFTTLTTVGYGDMVPVSTVGRMLGFFLLLLSLGVLASFISLLVTFLSGSALPRWRLKHSGRKCLNIFLNFDSSAEYLAEQIVEKDPASLVVFVCQKETSSQPLDQRYVQMSASPSEIADICHSEKIRIFQTDGIPEHAEELPGEVYCVTDLPREGKPASLHFFNPRECMARVFWKQKIFLTGNENIVIIGSGSLADSVLEWALLQNCIKPDQKITYHMFGDFSDFINNHPNMGAYFSVNNREATGDCLIFHQKPWNADPAVLRGADCIVFCDDEKQRNQKRSSDLKKYFFTRGKVFVYAENVPAEYSGFVSEKELYSPDQMIGEKQNKLARTMHALYQSRNGGPSWEEISDFQQRSNLAAADHVYMKLRILLGKDVTEPEPEDYQAAFQVYRSVDPAVREQYLELEHQRWMRFHLLHGWSYHEQRDNSSRQHPCLLPYHDLGREDQLKDEYSWKLLELLGE